jgi:hypothetical protein
LLGDQPVENAMRRARARVHGGCRHDVRQMMMAISRAR